MKTKKYTESLLNIFIVFFKIGIITFGGGYAMLSIMEKEIVDKKGWIDSTTMLDMTAIGESTPGAISLNLATFIGHKLHGFWGALIATLGVTLPSLIIICLVSLLINVIKDNLLISFLFRGVRAGVVALLLHAVVKFFKKLDKNIFTFVMLIASFLVALLTNIDVVYIILVSGVIGVIYMAIATRGGHDDDLS